MALSIYVLGALVLPFSALSFWRLDLDPKACFTCTLEMLDLERQNVLGKSVTHNLFKINFALELNKRASSQKRSLVAQQLYAYMHVKKGFKLRV